MGRKWRRAASVITILLGLGSLGWGLQQRGRPDLPTPGAAVQPGFYAVTKVFDGDTIAVKIAGRSEEVRLIGIDTPETHDPRKPVQCYGPVAAAATQKLLGGRLVRLAGDPLSSDRDKYHRLLRYVYLPDGTFVNQYLVEHGLAFAYIIFNNSKLQQFERWEADAKTAGRGLWSVCQVRLDGRIEQTNPLPDS